MSWVCCPNVWRSLTCGIRSSTYESLDRIVDACIERGHSSNFVSSMMAHIQSARPGYSDFSKSNLSPHLSSTIESFFKPKATRLAIFESVRGGRDFCSFEVEHDWWRRFHCQVQVTFSQSIDELQVGKVPVPLSQRLQLHYRFMPMHSSNHRWCPASENAESQLRRPTIQQPIGSVKGP